MFCGIYYKAKRVVNLFILFLTTIQFQCFQIRVILFMKSLTGYFSHIACIGINYIIVQVSIRLFQPVMYYLGPFLFIESGTFSFCSFAFHS